MGEVIYMGSYLRRLHNDMEELQDMTDDEVVIYMLRVEDSSG